MTMFNKIVKEFQWGQHKVRLETGEIAQAPQDHLEPDSEEQ